MIQPTIRITIPKVTVLNMAAKYFILSLFDTMAFCAVPVPDTGVPVNVPTYPDITGLFPIFDAEIRTCFVRPLECNFTLIWCYQERDKGQNYETNSKNK
jgi:hypothetical protein